MAARAISSGTISFGLVSIPVKIYSASKSKTVRFNMLDKSDHSRVKQQLVNASTGEVVERSETVKGYEYSRGQYVVMSEEELKALESKSDGSIEIEEFVPIERVDPRYFEKSQLLGPDKGGAKAYRLLNESMTLMGKVAVGRHSARGRHQLVLVRPVGRGLMLHSLYYADEVRDFDEVEFGDDVELKKGEVDLANQLIESLASDSFAPEKYEDEYRREVLASIERKVAGEQIVAAPAAEPRETIVDLVAALKQSLADKKTGTERKPAKKAAAKKAPSKKRASG